ncbi:MAG: hypothetical protein AAFX07_10825 [Pseudomonadota bacterium]
MTMKYTAIAALLAVSACSGARVPDSNPNIGGGVGFGSYDAYSAQQLARQRAARDAALEGVQVQVPVTEEQAIAQDTLGVLNQTSPEAASAQPVETAALGSLAVTPSQDNPDISDEQNFDAVSARETIESDRDRLQQQRQVYQQAQPEAVPERPSGRAAPNIVAYALETNNQVGQSIYRRSSRFNEDRYRRACAEFGSSDQAQAAFLAAGGPERDRRGLDPDGDGFACFWNPGPFRTARGG